MKQLVKVIWHMAASPRARIIQLHSPDGVSVHPICDVAPGTLHTSRFSSGISVGSAVFARFSGFPDTLRHADHGACDMCKKRPQLPHLCDACDAAYTKTKNVTYIQSGPKKLYVFNTPYLWKCSTWNETDFTKMFLEFLRTKIWF